MCSSNENNRNELGNSIFQIESRKYYDLFREIHSRIFTFNPRRILAEKTQERYHNGNVTGIRNLYTFVNFLKQLLSKKNQVKGIDYGCGDHYFVDDMRKQCGWDVVGYDADEIAIEKAQKKYPTSTDSYIWLDLLKNKIPQPDHSVDFVFCNAVIQHFSTEEFCFVLQEVARVLKFDGILLLIFKRNIENWSEYSVKMNLDVEIINEKEGIIKIEDEPMKNAIQKLGKQVKSRLENEYLKGLRLFHFFDIDEILRHSDQNGLKVIKNIEFENQRMEDAIFTYQSGKGIPTAAIFLKKY